MWELNSNIPLNLITNAMLLALSFTLLFSCMSDEFLNKRLSHKYFALWVFVNMIFIILDTLMYISIEFYFTRAASTMIFTVYSFFFYAMPVPPILWMLSTASEKSEIKLEKLKYLMLVPVVFSAAYLIWFNSSGLAPKDVYRDQSYSITFLIRNGGNILMYIISLAITVFYWKSFEHAEASALCGYIIIAILGMTQKLWINGFPNILSVALTEGIYVDIWQRQKDSLSQKEMQAAQQQEKLALQEVELTNAKVALMVSQIQPHFIYNTLSTIAFLCTKDPQKARRVTMDFADYLRGNINVAENRGLIPFSKELEHTEKYLQIELTRFSDTLNVEYEISATDFEIPPLTVQPIVENAVKHGVCKKVEGGTIKVSSWETDENWMIEISDDGVGFDMNSINLKDGSHFGISSSEQRLKNQCGGRLEIESEPGKGTRATIYIPKEADE